MVRRAFFLVGLVGLVLGLASCGFTPFAQIPFRVSLDEPVAVPTAEEPSLLFSADFNGDGHLDLAVIHSLQNEVVLYQGDGAGQFTAQDPLSTLPRPLRAQPLDYDRDGLTDLLILQDTSRQIAVLGGQVGSGLQAAQTVVLPAEGGVPVGFAVGDFNGDGAWDVAISHQGQALGTLLLGDGQGGFAPGPDLDFGAQAPRLVARDVNQDGFDDLLVIGDSGQGPAPGGGKSGEGGGRLWAYWGSAEGLGPGQLLFETTEGRLGRVSWGDLDGNGFQDGVMGLGQNTLLILPQREAGEFDDPLKFVVKHVGDLALVDLDLDGDLDVVTSESRQQLGPGKLKVLLNAGDGQLRKPQAFTVGYGAQAVAVGDFDENGWPDVAVASFFSKQLDLVFNRGRP